MVEDLLQYKECLQSVGCHLHRILWDYSSTTYKRFTPIEDPLNHCHCSFIYCSPVQYRCESFGM